MTGCEADARGKEKLISLALLAFEHQNQSKQVFIAMGGLKIFNFIFIHLAFLCKQKKGPKGMSDIIFNVHYKYLCIYYLLCFKEISNAYQGCI